MAAGATASLSTARKCGLPPRPPATEHPAEPLGALYPAPCTLRGSLHFRGVVLAAVGVEVREEHAGELKPLDLSRLVLVELRKELS